MHANLVNYLYRFFGPANEELYRLMESLGPASGWRGRFATSAEEYRQRQDEAR